MNCSMPGVPVHHQLPEYTQTHVHWVGDAIQQFHPLSSSSSPAFKIFQHQGLFQKSQLFASGGQSIGVSASATVLPINTQDWSPLGWNGWISLQSKGPGDKTWQAVKVLRQGSEVLWAWLEAGNVGVGSSDFSIYHLLSLSIINHLSITYLSSMYLKKVKVLVTQSCATLCDPMDCSLPVSSVHGILQARILEWVVILFSRASSQPKDWT